MLLEQVAAGQPGASLDALVALGHHLENHRDDKLDLVQVGDVVDKRQGLAGVDEPDRRGVAGRQDGRVGQAVETGVAGRGASLGSGPLPRRV